MIPTSNNAKIEVKALRIEQPIGSFFVAVFPSKALVDISYADIRRLEDRDMERYLGIQRPLNKGRVKELERYVMTVDATFPTSIIVSVDPRCVEWDEGEGTLTFFEYRDDEEEVKFGKIAKIIDGQHRIAGLDGLDTVPFQLNVAVFVDIDVSEQANIFSTVNLAQTKVNKSLVYDLYELAKTRSPQKTCHNIAVALNQSPESPLHSKIKRLGVATSGKFGETLTQATFVDALMSYISKEPLKDRDLLRRGRTLRESIDDEGRGLCFRKFFVLEQDDLIAKNVWNFFEAVRLKWPKKWADPERGNILNRTNGFRALMRFLGPVYNRESCGRDVVPLDDFVLIFNQISLEESDFNVGRFQSGSSGESALFHELMKQTGFE